MLRVPIFGFLGILFLSCLSRTMVDINRLPFLVFSVGFEVLYNLYSCIRSGINVCEIQNP